MNTFISAVLSGCISSLLATLIKKRFRPLLDAVLVACRLPDTAVLYVLLREAIFNRLGKSLKVRPDDRSKIAEKLKTVVIRVETTEVYLCMPTPVDVWKADLLHHADQIESGKVEKVEFVQVVNLLAMSKKPVSVEELADILEPGMMTTDFKERRRPAG